jgi:hypothetical protein
MLIAMDRALSGRRVDADGHLHVEVSNMTKATVNGYYGREIPGWQELGLDADRTYQMLRDPDEIRKGIGTLNGKPILYDHKPISADNHDHALTVGSTGTNAAFDGTYGCNSMSLWSKVAIDGVNSNRKRQLSAAYRYTPVMDAGEYQGLRYDGKMTDISFNHVALVIEGRAGPDVLVGDEAMKLKSRTGLLAQGVITATIAPALKPGSAIDLAPALEGVTAASFAMDGARVALADKVKAIVTPFLAADQNVDGLADALGTIQPVAADDDEIKEPVAKAEEKPAVKVETKEAAPAMDSATVDNMIAAAVAAAEARMGELNIALNAVKPFVGELVAMDSAPAVYKVALDKMGVALDGVPEVGFKALFGAMAKTKATPPVAQDAAPEPTVMTEIDKSLAHLGKVY